VIKNNPREIDKEVMKTLTKEKSFLIILTKVKIKIIPA
jgi:hypothetical protein